MIHYKENNVVHNVNFEVFSEYVNHDATGVHLYITKMINFFKNRFGAKSIKKIYYFSDGAKSQYKNRYNISNLMNHKKDFKIEAEWHFFATSHGKGPGDGIGGCVKKQAYRASLQNRNNLNITTTEKLYEWATKFFKKIFFDFTSLSEYEKHKKKLQTRFSKAKKITGTRQYHSYRVLNSTTIQCQIFSKQIESVNIKM